MDMNDHQINEQALIRINIEDMLVSLGWEKIRLGRPIIKKLFTWPARQFARQVIGYDQGVAQYGLTNGAQRFLSTYIKDLVIHDQHHIVSEGPLLILSNHPGMTDTVALFASLPRPDLRVLAAERPFLRALPGTYPSLFFIPEDGSGRMAVIRQSAQYLRSGGAVLTFPGGHIEPDPANMPGAAERLKDWSSSIGVFVRMVNGLQILPVIVSGVIAPHALNHPLTRLRRLPKDRERLAATLQIIAKIFFPSLWPVMVNVHFYPPLSGDDFRSIHDPEDITQAIVEKIKPYYLALTHNT
jgi:hypothetical protein